MAITTHGPAGDDPRTGPEPCSIAPENRLMTSAEVACILGGNVTADTVVRNWKRWKLPAHKVGRELRFWGIRCLRLDQEPPRLAGQRSAPATG